MFAGPIPRMIASELFRQGTRSVAMAAVGVSNWLSIFLIVISFELIRVRPIPFYIKVFAFLITSILF